MDRGGHVLLQGYFSFDQPATKSTSPQGLSSFNRRLSLSERLWLIRIVTRPPPATLLKLFERFCATNRKGDSMRLKTKVKSGKLAANHNMSIR